jgi:hypothetical protein
MKKSRKLSCHVVDSNIANGSLSTLQTSVVINLKDLEWRADSYRRLKYRGGCTIPLFELSVWCEKCVKATFYYWFQMTETGFAEQFYASHRMGREICLEFCENSLKRDLSKETTFNIPLFSLVNTFKPCHAPRYVQPDELPRLVALCRQW